MSYQTITDAEGREWCLSNSRDGTGHYIQGEGMPRQEITREQWRQLLDGDLLPTDVIKQDND